MAIESLLTFMCQDEVDLYSFSEVAEDINVRELSEENLKVINSSRDVIFTFNQENVDSSMKRIRSVEHIMDNNSVVKKVGDNDNNTKENFDFTDIDSKDNNEVYTENADKNDISILAARHKSCEKCNISPLERYRLRRHVQSSHESIYYLCNQCIYKGTQRECANTCEIYSRRRALSMHSM